MTSTPHRLRLAYRHFDGFERALRRQVNTFRTFHPHLDVELVPFEISDLYRHMVTGGECRSGDWDLFLASSDWLPELIDAGNLHPLDPFLTADPPPSWPTGWNKSLLRAQQDATGSVFGIPYHDGPEMLLYRADLFDDPDEQETFHQRFGRPLVVPATWDDFRQVAEFFTRPATGLVGCAIAGYPDGHNNVYDFLLQLWSRGGQLLREDHAAFAEQPGVAGLEYLRALLGESGVCQADPRGYDSVQAGQLFATGAAAMTCNWAGFAAAAELPGSAVAGRLRYGLIPRGPGPSGRHVTLSVYWVTTITQGSPNTAPAWQFLRHLASPDADRITAEEGSIGCRRSTWDDPDIIRRFPCFAHLEQLHEGAQTMPPIPKYPAINELLSEAVDAVHTGALDPATALSHAAAGADRLLAGARG